MTVIQNYRLLVFFIFGGLLANALFAAKNVAYIHGDVAENGDIPSGEGVEPYDQMLLDDTGNTGLSIFKAMVEAQGYTISQYYDADLTFDAAFLNQFDVVVFGLHQRVWNSTEQQILDDWIRAGGGILMYNDSAAGGKYNAPGVGVNNPTGQTAVNSILSNYDMQVTVDQGGGTRSYRAPADTTNPIVYGELIFEGEGVSPIAVDPTGIAEVLIPLTLSNKVSGNDNAMPSNTSNITISNPAWAVIAHAKVGDGHVMAIFDRQPMWNDGPGSDIEKRDNYEILRRIIRYLASDYGNSQEWVDPLIESDDPANFQLSYRQWIGGTGADGFDYTARNTIFALEQRADLGNGDWRTESGLVQALSSAALSDGESERVSVRLLPDAGAEQWFARVVLAPDVPQIIPTVEAGRDQLVGLSGSIGLYATVSNALSQTWSKVSGPGTVTFADASAVATTVSFSSAGEYVLKISATGTSQTVEDSLSVTVVDPADVVIAINAGGSAYTGQNGFNYVADVHYDGGGIDAYPDNAVANTLDDLLYNYARSKNSTFAGYSIPVSNGNYLVYIQFAETFFSSAGSRVFDLSIEGVLELDDFDIVESSGGKWVAYDQAFTTTVSDSVLDIDVSVVANNPLINAIVVVELP